MELYPFHNIFNPILAVVFSGNSIVIKVSEYASWSGCFYIRIIQAALAAVGTPENLVDIITGFAETGKALVSSVDKVIIVGSPGVGRMVQSSLGLQNLNFVPEFHFNFISNFNAVDPHALNMSNVNCGKYQEVSSDLF